MAGSIRRVIVFLIFLAFAAALVGYFLFRTSGAQSGRVFQSPLAEQIFNLPTPTPIPFAEMTIPYIRQQAFVSELGERKQVSQNASYTSYVANYQSDGLTNYGLLTVPQGQKPASGWPAIVFVHGYIPPEQYQTTKNYVSYVDTLARKGFVVFKIDLRGHGDSEGEAGGGYYSADYIVDTLNARAALASSGFVNPMGIGLWGHSMAGNVVMRALAAKTDIPAVVVWAGAGYTYTDLQDYSIDDASYRPPPQNTARARRRQLLRETYGEFSEDSPFWRQVAVTDYLADIKGAIQVHHAVDDPVVGIEYSRNLMRLLDQTRVSHELLEYPTGGHNITGASYTQAMQKTVEFFRTHL